MAISRGVSASKPHVGYYLNPVSAGGSLDPAALGKGYIEVTGYVVPKTEPGGNEETGEFKRSDKAGITVNDANSDFPETTVLSIDQLRYLLGWAVYFYTPSVLTVNPIIIWRIYVNDLLKWQLRGVLSTPNYGYGWTSMSLIAGLVGSTMDETAIDFTSGVLYASPDSVPILFKKVRVSIQLLSKDPGRDYVCRTSIKTQRIK